MDLCSGRIRSASHVSLFRLSAVPHSSVWIVWTWVDTSPGITTHPARSYCFSLGCLSTRVLHLPMSDGVLVDVNGSVFNDSSRCVQGDYGSVDIEHFRWQNRKVDIDQGGLGWNGIFMLLIDNPQLNRHPTWTNTANYKYCKVYLHLHELSRYVICKILKLVSSSDALSGLSFIQEYIHAFYTQPTYWCSNSFLVPSDPWRTLRSRTFPIFPPKSSSSSPFQVANRSFSCLITIWSSRIKRTIAS